MRTAIWIAVIGTATAASWACGAEPEVLRTAGDRPIDVLHLKLELEVDLDAKRVDAVATLDFTALRPVRNLSLDAVELEVESVVDGAAKKLTYSATGEKLVVDLGETLKVGAAGRLVVKYKVREPKNGLFFFGPTPREPKTPRMVWSQGEQIGNRYWFPCLDHSNEMQTTELVVAAEKGMEVLSNGVLVEKKELNDKQTRWHWKQEQPHVSYLVTLVVGRFHVAKEEWRRKPVYYYVPPERAADAGRTFGRTVQMMDFFSDRFGVEYPWPKYAQVVVEQFMWGGMENTSATTLVHSTMHDERAMLDDSPDWLIAHELAHQWWGDLLTCKDWSHLWLNEGFATYCEWLWMQHAEGDDAVQERMLRDGEAARSDGPKKRPVVDRYYTSPGSMFDARSYPKGAWVVHMLRQRVGDVAFFAGLKQYLTEYRHRTVETDDLRLVFERTTGRSLERFFHDWTERPGHPVVEVNQSYDADAKAVLITVKQTQTGDAFHFPLKVEVRVPGAEPIASEIEVVAKEAFLRV
ncbi:MAG: M1 family metallopeptidase, partial [Planctomycetia bacterium]